MDSTKTIKEIDFRSDVKPDWCPSCGDFGVLSSLIKALASLGIEPKNAVAVSGIGCSSNLPGFIRTFGFHSLHGRSLPVATGIKLANPSLTVVATGGDGDGYGIGMGHFIHTLRRNLDITYIVMNNQVYGLTTGQVSPTSSKGFVTKTTPKGNLEEPVNPLLLAIAGGATFVARGFSGDPNHMTGLIAQGIAHKGFALIDVFSPCVTFNKINTYDFFRQRVYKLQENGYDASSFENAIAKAREWGDKIPIGLLYKSDRPALDQEKTLKSFPHPADWSGRLPEQEIQKIIKEFK